MLHTAPYTNCTGAEQPKDGRHAPAGVLDLGKEEEVAGVDTRLPVSQEELRGGVAEASQPGGWFNALGTSNSVFCVSCFLGTGDIVMTTEMTY